MSALVTEHAVQLSLLQASSVQPTVVCAAQVGDPLRINLKFPPDQYMYVKATTASERQQWLVALGSSKACLTQGNTPKTTKTNHHHGKQLYAYPNLQNNWRTALNTTPYTNYIMNNFLSWESCSC